MVTRPFRDLLKQLPPRWPIFARRRHLREAHEALSQLGKVKARGRSSRRLDMGLHTHLPAPDAAPAPWTVSRVGDNKGIRLQPGFIRAPGSPDAVWPLIGGRLITDPEAVIRGELEGFICLSVQLKQPARRMGYNIYGFVDDAWVIIDSLTATIMLVGENTVEIEGTPEITVVTSLRGSSASYVADSTAASAGSYLIPLAHISRARIVQFMSHNLDITLRGGFLRLIRLGT